MMPGGVRDVYDEGNEATASPFEAVKLLGAGVSRACARSSLSLGSARWDEREAISRALAHGTLLLGRRRASSRVCFAEFSVS